MIKPPNHLLNNAFQISKVIASGGATVFVSTLASCYFAIVIENTAHKIQYRFFPHWYTETDIAVRLGLENGSNRINQYQNQNQTKEEDVQEKTNNQLDAFGEIIDHGIGLMGSFDGDRIGGAAAATTSNEETTIGLHHSELHPFWKDDFDHSAMPKYGEDKFELPSTDPTSSLNTKNTNTNTIFRNNSTNTAGNGGNGGGSDDNVSSLSALKELVIGHSRSGESISAALQGCAMTA